MRYRTGITKEEKAAWIAALRSGEYKQGKGFLKKKVGETYEFCCMGVLATIIDPTNLRSTELCTNIYNYYYSTKHPHMYSPYISLILIPGEEKDLEGVLARMNDDGKTFPEIADWIKENVPTND